MRKIIVGEWLCLYNSAVLRQVKVVWESEGYLLSTYFYPPWSHVLARIYLRPSRQRIGVVYRMECNVFFFFFSKNKRRHLYKFAREKGTSKNKIAHAERHVCDSESTLQLCSLFTITLSKVVWRFLLAHVVLQNYRYTLEYVFEREIHVYSLTAAQEIRFVFLFCKNN